MAVANFKRMIKARIPILKWLPRYKPTDALGDFVAGLTVGLTLIPQVRKTRYTFVRPPDTVFDLVPLFGRC